MHKLLACAAALVACPLSPVAADITMQTTVRVADLDLASPSGIARLDRRIRAAAAAVCGTPATYDPAGANDIRRCRAQVRGSIAPAAPASSRPLAESGRWRRVDDPRDPAGTLPPLVRPRGGNEQEQPMAIFNKDMVELANRNTLWQKEVYRDPKVQVVLMSIPAGEEIGLETHPADQTTFIVSGTAQVVIEGQSTKAGPNHMVIVPKGAEHNIVNKGKDELKLCSVYAPPAEPEGAAFKTKAEAEEAEKGLLARAVDTVKGALGR